MNGETMIALLIFLIPLAYSPGPGNLTFAANGARFGVTGLIPALAGDHLATLAVTVLLAQASGAALTGVPGIAGLIQIAGRCGCCGSHGVLDSGGKRGRTGPRDQLL